ncbi:DUF6790 family protein [Variovorax sp.]|uniref:DUF6790 family protein n=1 Tax=Variovorax sp. TaxID=1871043 RepID=UPI002D5875BF|nr:DUF6790 family protein [Variovorax sp.]HYP84146.1 DUF6790 family protein [Variovorax sp.]
MYYLSVSLLMFVFPVSAVVIEQFTRSGPPLVESIARWSAFWAVGVRLFLAGARQIINPAYTARTLLGIAGTEPLLLVRELGFANVSFGALGLLSLWRSDWVPAACLAGGLFFALAGIGHVFHPHRNRLENVAMASDLLAALVLLGCLGTMLAIQ